MRAPVPAAASRNEIMAQVRTVPNAERPRRALALYGRKMRQSIIGLAWAAGIGSIATFSAIAPTSMSTARTAGIVTGVVIGDTVVNRFRDTLRLVRLMFDDSTAQQVAIAGDFNAWNDDATRMRRDAHTGKWTTTVALRDGDHRYAIVVDNLRWAGRLHVARTN
jgi:hypothetical protein